MALSFPARKWFGSQKSRHDISANDFPCNTRAISATGTWALFAIPWAPTITDPLMSVHCNSFVVTMLGLKLVLFSVMKTRVCELEWKEKKIVSYKGPMDGKPSTGNPRGKVSFPLRMPLEGEKHGVEMENSLTAINKGAECVRKIKPHTTTMRRS